MVIHISRREVLNNLIRFKDNLLEMRSKEKSSHKKHGRTYRVMLNRRTGDMRFAQKISSIEHHFSRKGKGSAEDWKEVHIIVDQKNPQSPVHFELKDERDHEMRINDLDPLAWRIARETIEALNQKSAEEQPSKLSPEMLPEEAVLQDLSTIHLAPNQNRIDDLPGWSGHISRLQAEKRLSGKPVGTYLLREADPITASIALNLSIANRMPVRAYIITIVERRRKISESMILQIRHDWILYSDEPRLSTYSPFPTPSSLLLALSPIAKHPLS